MPKNVYDLDDFVKNFPNKILRQQILSEKIREKKSEIENLQDKLFDFYVCQQNLTNVPLEFILASNKKIFKMMILTNVIFVTLFLQKYQPFSTHKKCS